MLYAVILAGRLKTQPLELEGRLSRYFAGDRVTQF